MLAMLLRGSVMEDQYFTVVPNDPVDQKTADVMSVIVNRIYSEFEQDLIDMLLFGEPQRGKNRA